MKKAFVFGALWCCLIPGMRAQVLAEAVAAFPAQTTSLEYDALSKLRVLPDYRSLRKQYSGEDLQRVQKDLLLLGISEDQLTEVVTASGVNGFFGMVAGNFQASSIPKLATEHAMTQSTLTDGPVFCAKDGTCLLMLTQEAGRGFFGTMAQLRALSDVRQGRTPSLETNAAFMYLKSRMDPQAPVVGFAPGREIGEWIGNGIPEAIAARLDLAQLFSNIDSFGYSVKLDSKAHVDLNLICVSEQAGTVLRDTLSAASGLQRAAALAAGSAALPFSNMAVRSSGRMVAVNLDAPLP